MSGISFSNFDLLGTRGDAGDAFGTLFDKKGAPKNFPENWLKV